MGYFDQFRVVSHLLISVVLQSLVHTTRSIQYLVDILLVHVILDRDKKDNHWTYACIVTGTYSIGEQVQPSQSYLSEMIFWKHSANSFPNNLFFF